MRARLLIIGLLLSSACSLQQSMPTATPLPTSPPTLTPLPPTDTPFPTPTSTSTPTLGVTVSEQIPVLIGSLNVINAPGIAIRRDPYAASEVVLTVPGGTVAWAQQRTADEQWIEVSTDRGVVGWVAASTVYTSVNLAQLPIFGAPTVIAAMPTNTFVPTIPAPPTAVTLGDMPAMERHLRETPIFSNLATQHLTAIFQTGRLYGNRPNVFTTIGDSNTTNGDFLQPIGMGADTYCTWSDYTYLHTTVNFFSVPPSPDLSNSFTHHSLSAGKGFSSAAVLDPFWATDATCLADELPLACELRTIKPSVAIIMLGGIDVSAMSTADYAANMTTIVELLIQQGVIPVLTTFVVLPGRDVYEKSLEFNMRLLDLSQAEQIPLINLWTAAQTLPDDGIGPDHTHLKAEIGSFCAFDGGQTQYGGTLRNLLTLQALDQLRQNVLMK